MKLTKSQLKQVIKEELAKLLQEQGGLRGRSDAAFGDLTRRTQPQQRRRQQAPARQSTLAQVGLNRINRFRQWTGNKPLTKLHWKRYLQLEKDPKYAKAIANLIKDLLTRERDNKAKAQRQPGQPAPKRTATGKAQSPAPRPAAYAAGLPFTKQKAIAFLKEFNSISKTPARQYMRAKHQVMDEHNVFDFRTGKVSDPVQRAWKVNGILVLQSELK